MEIAVLIPSLDPDQHLVDVVEGCLQEGLRNIVVIDDGSAEDCRWPFRKTEALGAILVRHSENRGKGAALKTGLQAAREHYPDLDGVVTADGDGQHLPVDIRRVAEAMTAAEHPFVLGVRDFSGDDVPWRSRLGNRITAKLFQISTGVRCADTQTGLRAIPRELFDQVLSLPGDRYEYEINMLNSVIGSRYPVEMVPIETVYEDNNRTSHFRTVADSALIYQRPLKYAATSLIGCAVDLLLFWLLSGRFGIMVSTAVARCVSGYTNFKLNQLWCFQVRKKTRAQFYKYVLLCVAVMLISGGAVTVLQVLPLPLTLTKVLVDSALFAANYYIQRCFIFRDEQTGIF